MAVGGSGAPGVAWSLLGGRLSAVPLSTRDSVRSSVSSVLMPCGPASTADCVGWAGVSSQTKVGTGGKLLGVVAVDGATLSAMSACDK